MSTSQRARYESLLVQLHREMRAGQGDDARAHELRDEMAEVWYGLSEEEQAICDELSEDLYVIEGKRAVVPLAEGETEESVSQQLAAAFKAEDNRRGLALIRKLPSRQVARMGEDRVTYAMSRCWERQDFFRAAACFYDFAHELKPNDVYEVMALEALVRAGALDEAGSRARAIEQRPIASGTLLLKVASVLHRTAAMTEASKRRVVYERVIQLVEAAWDDPTALASLRATGLVVAGFSYERLGDKDRALRCFERAVAVHRSEGPLLAYGLALLHVDRPRALRDITEAAKLGTKLDWPYVYAAQHAIELSRFAEVERFCEAGIALTKRGELRGRLYEWWAIALAAAGRPPGEATALFEQAMAELPFDLVLRRNFRRFRESLEAERTIPSDAWEVAMELDEDEARASLAA